MSMSTFGEVGPSFGWVAIVFMPFKGLKSPTIFLFDKTFQRNRIKISCKVNLTEKIL